MNYKMLGEEDEGITMEEEDQLAVIAKRVLSIDDPDNELLEENQDESIREYFAIMIIAYLETHSLQDLPKAKQYLLETYVSTLDHLALIQARLKKNDPS